jgi:hypothetical protein
MTGNPQRMIMLTNARKFLLAALAAASGSSAFAGVSDDLTNHLGAVGNPEERANVPVVNCATDGKPAKAASQNHQQVATAPARVAPKLAYYTGELGGVLAPRGWRCDSWFNSAGITIYVEPRGNAANGPFVRNMMAMDDANFSQKEIVATVAARLFPAHVAYVKDVVAQEHENDGGGTYDIPIGPHPADRITRRTATVVEFITPPNKYGMGTEFGIEKSASPVFGAAFLASDNSSVKFVCVRLPDELKSLAQTIVRSAEPKR